LCTRAVAAISASAMGRVRCAISLPQSGCDGISMRRIRPEYTKAQLVQPAQQSGPPPGGSVRAFIITPS